MKERFKEVFKKPFKEIQTRDIYRAIGANGIENAAFFLLMLWVFWPVYRAITGALFMIFLPHDVQLALTLDVPFVTTFYHLGLITVIFVLLNVFFICKKFFKFENMKKQPWFYMLFFLLVWSVISWAHSEHPWDQLNGHPDGADGLTSFFIYGSCMFCAVLIRSVKKKRIIIYSFTTITTFCSLLMLGQVKGLSFFTGAYGTGPDSVFDQFNHFGYYLTMSICCCFGMFIYEESVKARAYALLSLTFQFYCLVINDTFGCYLATVCATVFILAFVLRSSKKFHWSFLIPVAVYIGLSVLNKYAPGLFFKAASNVGSNLGTFVGDVDLVIKDPENAGGAGTTRFMLWTNAIRMFVKRPILGYGPEGFFYSSVWPLYDWKPHNEYIQYLSFLGIPGIVAYLGAIITLFVHQWINLKKLKPTTIIIAGIIAGYMISACFGNTKYYVSPIFFMFLGFAASLDDDSEPLFMDME